MTDSVNQTVMKVFFRTAPATPGLLKRVRRRRYICTHYLFNICAQSENTLDQYC